MWFDCFYLFQFIIGVHSRHGITILKKLIDVMKKAYIYILEKIYKKEILI